MATGDILSVVVDPQGYCAKVTIEGFAVGATYNFAIGALNAPGVATPLMTVISEGFNTAGVLGTIGRQVYLTTAMMKPWPDNAVVDEAIVAGNLVVRVALSDHVYDDDRNGGAGTSGTDPVITFPAGWAINSGGAGQSSRAGSGLPVTNSSTLDYAQAIANWSRNDRFRLSTASVKLGVVAFHGQARNQRPVACVKFTAADTSAHTSANVQTVPQIDGDFGDQVPVIEYISTLDLTGFTDDQLITCDFVAYPWVGDENSVLSSAALAEAETGQNPSAYFVLDVDGSRGYPMCVVDPSAADDSLGTVYASDTSGNRTTAQAHPFKNLYQAVRKVYEYNLANNGRSNAGGATIYLAAGTTDVAGGLTATPTTVSGNVWTWLTIQPLPGVTTAVLTPNTTAANRVVAAPGVRYKSCAFLRSSDSEFFRGTTSPASRALLEDCTLADTRATNTQANVALNTAVKYVRCTATNIIFVGGWKRGCRVPGGNVFALGQLSRVVIGNDFTQTYFSNASTQSNDAEGAILAFNKMWATSHDIASLFQLGTTVTYTRGFAMVQNLIECLDTASEPLLRVHADQTVGAATRDCVIWHNTFAGQRCNLFYNDNGSLATPHLGHSVCHNAMVYFANKGDTFGGNSGPNGARTGNWPVRYGAHTWGNRISRGSFNQLFRGLWSGGGDDSTPVDLGYVDDLSGAGVGNGDYHSVNGAFMRGVLAPQMLAFDIEGNPRNPAVEAAGAYAVPGGALPPPVRKLFIATIGGAATPVLLPAQYYLDPENQTASASDSNPGTDPALPLLTLSAALGKAVDSFIAINTRGIIRPISGAYSALGCTAWAHSRIRTNWAVLQPWGTHTYGFGSDYSLPNPQGMIVDCPFLDIRGATLVGEGFRMLMPAGQQPPRNFKLNGWTLTADPANKLDASKSYGVCGMVIQSPSDFEIHIPDWSGGDWTIPGSGGGGLHLNGTPDAPITNGLVDVYMHDWTDGDGIDIQSWSNLEVRLKARRSNRLNGALHQDLVQLFDQSGGDDIRISVDADGSTYGTYIRSTDLDPTNDPIATNVLLFDCVCPVAGIGSAQSVALAHTPGLKVDNSILAELYLLLHSGVPYTGPGADITNSQIGFYSNSSTKQINSIDDYTRAHITTVDTGSGKLALP